MIAGAAAAGDHILVSGDHHLLALERVNGIAILTASQAVARIEDRLR